MKILNIIRFCASTGLLYVAVLGMGVGLSTTMLHADEPAKGTAKQIDLGRDVNLEIVYIPPGKFKMGSSAAEKEWAVGQDGGASFSSGNGAREAGDSLRRPVTSAMLRNRVEQQCVLIKTGSRIIATPEKLHIHGSAWRTKAGEIPTMVWNNRRTFLSFVSAITI